MSSDLKKEYTLSVVVRYLKARKGKKTRILDEFCETTGFNRKYAIRLLGKPYNPIRRPGRKPTYSPQADYHLRRLWLLMNQMCSKHMKAALSVWLPKYVHCSESVKKELLSMSHSTIDRKLKAFRVEHRRKKRSGTRIGKLCKTIIPIRPFDREEKKPGFVEADTVAHCGDSMAGEFVWSLTLTDVHSGWTENRAIWAKKSVEVLDALRQIEDCLPFEILAFNCDNGSEFINHEIIKYFGPEGEKRRLHQLMTRSRAYRKNDNCHVEQKNWTHVREVFGYDRIWIRALIPLMNDIYRNEHSLLYNFFVPQVKLISKERIGAKYRRKFSKPRTPYQALLASENISEEQKRKLTTKFLTLDPFALRSSIEKKMKEFFQKLYPVHEEQNKKVA
jgi:hypothetical protein